MKNRNSVCFTAICLVLIIYGLFSLHIALDVLWQTHQADSSQPVIMEIITLSGNKIEYYNI